MVANGPASLAGVLPGQRPLGLLRYGNGGETGGTFSGEL